ncbi:MAG TPA: sigma factor-like helix-turn-helix DNA-binding protein [Thermoleophilaceae bacterium]
MATFDQLPAEQRAIIELVVQRGRSYEDLAGMLDITSARVRELAREALSDLAPVTSARVDRERLAQIADYVLGQQSGAELTATRAHLRRSEAARAWTLSLVDSLDEMYANGTRPEVPEVGEPEPPRRRERERERERPREREPARARDGRGEREPLRGRDREPRRRAEPLSAEAETAVRRRRLVAAGLAGVLLLAAIVFGITQLVGGSDDDKSAKKSTPAAVRPQGVAFVAQRKKETDLVVQAKLPPTKAGQAYEVWLYNSPTSAVPVGAQVTDAKGNYQGAGKLPGDLTKYKAIDVSLQTIPNAACQKDAACLKRTSAHSGRSVLRGAIASIQRVDQQAAAKAGQPNIIGQLALKPVTG